MADRLGIYNGALLLCKTRSIASLTVNEEGRRLLDQVWADGGVRYCLERGQWRFAMRDQQIYHDPSIDPAWGYRYAFAKPDDWLVTSAVCQDEFFRIPLLQYTDQASWWFAAIDPIYVRFVSSHADYGGNLAKWPATFTQYVEAYFASCIVGKIASDDSTRTFLLGAPGRVEQGELHKRLVTAKNRDSMDEPTKYPAQGTWSRARQRWRRGGPMGDGGNPGSLIG